MSSAPKKSVEKKPIENEFRKDLLNFLRTHVVSSEAEPALDRLMNKYL